MNLLMVATTSVNFNYSENNPLTNKDSSGVVVETVLDVVTLTGSSEDIAKILDDGADEYNVLQYHKAYPERGSIYVIQRKN